MRQPLTRRRGRILWILATALSILAVSIALNHRRHANASERGLALFRGTAPLSARLHGHEALLPIEATRCINCHGATPDNDATARAALNAGFARPAPSFARVLDRAGLTQPRSRRGGPASVFDARALCVLMRTGVDPARIVVPDAMPRYEATDAQCDDLWAYFLSQ